MPERRRVVAVLGDLVASREAADRDALQRALEDTLDTVNAQVNAAQPLTPTVGDESQGLFDDLDAALAATLWTRLLLLSHTDVRFGVGVGELASYDAERAPFAQDGPAWWAAREALDYVEASEHTHAAPPGWRTCVRLADDQAPPGKETVDGADPEALVNAFLVCRDELVTRLDERDTRILLRCLEGESQTAIAEQEAISASAVSQRLRRNGGYALLRSRHLAGGPA